MEHNTVFYLDTQYFDIWGMFHIFMFLAENAF